VTDVCYPQQALKKSGQYNRLRVSCVLPAWSSRSRRLAAPRASSAPGPEPGWERGGGSASREMGWNGSGMPRGAKWASLERAVTRSDVCPEGGRSAINLLITQTEPKEPQWLTH